MSNVLSLRLVLRRRLVLPPCGPGAVSVPSLSRALCWGPAPPSVASTARLAEAVTSSALFSQVLSTAGSSSSEDGLVSSFLFYLCGIGTFSFFFLQFLSFRWWSSRREEKPLYLTGSVQLETSYYQK